MSKRRPKLEPALVTHRDVARRVGVAPARIREWVRKGSWPAPHAVVEETWFYRTDMIDHFVATGSWPPR